MGIYLVVINLTLETDKQRDHALFWMESVTRCDKGNCILVGTRTAQVVVASGGRWSYGHSPYFFGFSFSLRFTMDKK